jgi:two-component system, OmpR family, response regulator CssR
MSSPTVYLIGVTELMRVPDYLSLGAVVVIAPDRRTLRAWEKERSEMSFLVAAEPPATGLDVDIEGRRVRWNGKDLRLTPLEFRVFVTMSSRPGKAWSFEELRRSGWGPDPAQGIDVFAVRSVIQRLRRKLRSRDVSVEIESVRAFGFRLMLDRQSGRRKALASVR